MYDVLHEGQLAGANTANNRLRMLQFIAVFVLLLAAISRIVVSVVIVLMSYGSRFCVRAILLSDVVRPPPHMCLYLWRFGIRLIIVSVLLVSETGGM